MFPKVHVSVVRVLWEHWVEMENGDVYRWNEINCVNTTNTWSWLRIWWYNVMDSNISVPFHYHVTLPNVTYVTLVSLCFVCTAVSEPSFILRHFYLPVEAAFIGVYSFYWLEQLQSFSRKFTSKVFQPMTWQKSMHKECLTFRLH